MDDPKRRIRKSALFFEHPPPLVDISSHTLSYQTPNIQYVCNPLCSMYTHLSHIYTHIPRHFTKTRRLSFQCNSPFLFFSLSLSPKLAVFCILSRTFPHFFLPMTSYVAISATLILFSHSPLSKNCYLSSMLSVGCTQFLRLILYYAFME